MSNKRTAVAQIKNESKKKGSPYFLCDRNILNPREYETQSRVTKDMNKQVYTVKYTPLHALSPKI